MERLQGLKVPGGEHCEGQGLCYSVSTLLIIYILYYNYLIVYIYTYIHSIYVYES